MRRKVLCLFVISLACFLPVAAGDVYHFRDKVVWARFEGRLIIQMIAYEVREQRPPGNSTTRGQLIFQWQDEDWNGFQVVKDLLPEEFQFVGMQWARIATEVEVIDTVSGDPLTFVVDVTVNATEPAERFHYYHHTYGPGLRLWDQHGTEVFRLAEAVGTVFLGTENLTPGPSVYADLTYFKNMLVCTPATPCFIGTDWGDARGGMQTRPTPAGSTGRHGLTQGILEERRTVAATRCAVRQR